MILFGVKEDVVKLRELRELVKSYNVERSSVRVYVKGEHGRLKPIKDYIKGFADKQDDYALTNAQILELVLLFPEYKETEYKEDSNLGEFINGLKLIIGMSDSLLELVKALKNKNLMDEKLFTAIYAHPQLVLNNDLILEAKFLKTLSENHVRKMNYVRAVLAISERCAGNVPFSMVKSFITTFIDNKLLTDTAIASISNTPNKCTKYFFELVQTFSSTKLLTQANFEFLLKTNSTTDLQIYLLGLMDVPSFSIEKLMSILIERQDPVFIKLCYHLKVNSVDLNDTLLTQLIKLEPGQLDRMSVDHEFRNGILFLMAEGKDDIFIQAAKQSVEYVKLCTNLGKYDFKFLDSDIMYAFSKLEARHLDLISEIVDILKSASLMSRANVSFLATMNPRHLPKVLEILTDSKNAELLTDVHLNEILVKMHKKSPAFDMDKASCEESEQHSKYTISFKDKEKVVYTKKANKTIDNGTPSSRSVEKGYTSPTAEFPKYSITWFDDGQEKRAKKDAKYKRIYYDTPSFFQKGNQYGVMTEWERGSILDTMGNTIQTLPVKQRLTDFKTLLIDLNILHKECRVIGNLTPANCNYNLVEKLITFISYDAARKGGSMSNDMLGLVSVLNCLFKDILESDYSLEAESSLTQLKACLKIAILNLVDTLSLQEKRRPTVVMVIDFVDAISDKLDVLTPEVVTEITDKILKNRPCEFSDIMRGRSMMM